MSVSVSMPQLGESVTEGTVTRWLKHEGERVEADEPLLEVSTDKVDTEIPSPVSGILRDITVAEDETVAVGAELAIIDEEGSTAAAAAVATPAGAAQPAAGPGDAPEQAQPPELAQPLQASDSPQPDPSQAAGAPPASASPEPDQPGPARPGLAPAAEQAGPEQPGPAQFADAAAGGSPAAPAAAYQPSAPQQLPADPSAAQPPAAQPTDAQPTDAQATDAQATDAQPSAAAAGSPSPGYQPPGYQPSGYQGSPGYQAPGYQQPAPQPPADQVPAGQAVPAQGYYQPPAFPPAAPRQAAPPADGQPGAAERAPDVTESPYVTPLVRKLAAEHGVDLATISGTGVGGRIRKQDVLDVAQARRDSGQPAAAGPPVPGTSGAAAAVAPAAVDDTSTQQAERPAIVPSRLRGTTERMSRARQVIAQRMLESLQTSAQLTTVAEADVTAIARLRDRARAAFEAREGVKLSFLPFFALAAVEALKVHPKLNAFIDTANGLVTYHDAEHLGIAVDTERGLMVPVIRDAGDLNIAGLARKIADLAQRTRAGRVSPDDLSGGTFTLTNTGSRGALFDTPIINQPQVGILGTGTVVKRAVVVDDPALGEVITVRSMVYLSLTYDHRLVDGADAARFLITMKSRLEEGAFETELGL